MLVFLFMVCGCVHARDMNYGSIHTICTSLVYHIILSCVSYSVVPDLVQLPVCDNVKRNEMKVPVKHSYCIDKAEVLSCTLNGDSDIYQNDRFRGRKSSEIQFWFYLDKSIVNHQFHIDFLHS